MKGSATVPEARSIVALRPKTSFWTAVSCFHHVPRSAVAPRLTSPRDGTGGAMCEPPPKAGSPDGEDPYPVTTTTLSPWYMIVPLWRSCRISFVILVATPSEKSPMFTECSVYTEAPVKGSLHRRMTS